MTAPEAYWKATMQIEDAMAKLPTLNHVGFALLQFVYTLEKGRFVSKDTDWVYAPKHFVAFGFPRKKPEQIRLLFRPPLPHYINANDEKLLPLYDGRWNHYKCLITSPRELACAVRFIEAAYFHPC
jgi:hypothetical protein